MSLNIQYEKYFVLSGESQSELVDNVNKFFTIGWICQGGIAVRDTPDSVRYYQAMVKPFTL